MNMFQDHMPILFELSLSVIRSIKGFPRIDKDSQTCIYRSLNKGNNKITELRAILQRESQNS